MLKFFLNRDTPVVPELPIAAEQAELSYFLQPCPGKNGAAV